MRLRRRTPVPQRLGLSVAALSVLALAGACGSDSPAAVSLPPAPGKATLVVAPSCGKFIDEVDTSRSLDGNGLVSLPSGDLLLGDGLQRLDPAKGTLGAGTASSSLSRMFWPIALRDGSLVGAASGAVYQAAQPSAAWKQIAGVSDAQGTVRARKPGATDLPHATSADGFALDATVHVIGQRPDGSIIIVDGSVVWSLKGGTLTQLYQGRAVPAGGRDITTSGQTGYAGAVTADGTIVITTPTGNDRGYQLRDVVTIAPDGTVAPLDVPDAIPGMADPPASYQVNDIVAADGALYFRITDHDGFLTAHHQVVLRHRATGWDLIAAVTGSWAAISTTTMSRGQTVDAHAIPVGLPSSMAVRPGMLVMADPVTPITSGPLVQCPYALAIGLPR